MPLLINNVTKSWSGPFHGKRPGSEGTTGTAVSGACTGVAAALNAAVVRLRDEVTAVAAPGAIEAAAEGATGETFWAVVADVVVGSAATAAAETRVAEFAGAGSVAALRAALAERGRGPELPTAPALADVLGAGAAPVLAADFGRVLLLVADA